MTMSAIHTPTPAVPYKSHNARRKTNYAYLYKALEVFRSISQWPGGKTVDILPENASLRDRPCRIWLQNRDNAISIVLFVEAPKGQSMNKRFTSKPFPIGHFDYKRGWVQSDSATEPKYLAWRNQTIRELDKVN